MTRFDRVTVASRTFTFAAVLGLAASTGNAVALQSAVLLGALSLVAALTTVLTRADDGVVAGIEAAVSGLLIGMALPDSVPLLPYVVIPPLIAGAARGVQAAAWTTVAQTIALVGIDLLSDEPFIGTEYDVVAPWILAAVGAGLLGTLLRQLQTVPGANDPNQSYESARRLLSQLRTVARRLSSGLDPVGMASQALAVIHDHLSDTRAALFVRTEGGALTALGYRGQHAEETLLPTDPIIEECWAAAEPVHARLASGGAQQRIALPLRVGTRLIGLVVVDTTERPDLAQLDFLMQYLDEHSVRIDAALAFDEVRSIATMEERRRLAREIHDGIAQEVASLGYAIDELTADTTSPTQRRRLEELRSEVTRVVHELRLSIFDLRAQVDPVQGLGSALSDYVRLVGSRSNFTVHLTLDEEPTRLRPDVEAELFRIAQEAVTNARKHSGAKNLWVHCRVRPPYARIDIRDDGSGMGTARHDSYGLKIMRERADRIDATLSVQDAGESNDSTGTLVSVAVCQDALATEKPR